MARIPHFDVMPAAVEFHAQVGEGRGAVNEELRQLPRRMIADDPPRRHVRFLGIRGAKRAGRVVAETERGVRPKSELAQALEGKGRFGDELDWAKEFTLDLHAQDFTFRAR